MTDADSPPLARSGRGGARPGAGRKRQVSQAAGNTSARQEATAAGYFVYVVHEADHPDACKIGIAKDPMVRFSTLQVGTWRQLTLACALGVASQSAALEVELEVHSRLRDKHLRGEWFAVTASGACAMVLESVNKRRTTGAPMLESEE